MSTAVSPLAGETIRSDFDPFSPATRADPYGTYAELRAAAPVIRLTRYDIWAVPRFAEVKTIFGDHLNFSNAGGAGRNFAFTQAAAKYLANAMTYDDVIRVADLKTRSARRARIEGELDLSGDQVLQTTEFMHPRMEEVMGMLPAGFGRWLSARPRLLGWLDRRVNKGRRVKTYSLPWFVALYVVGGLRGMRRRSLRHAVETAHRDEWLKAATEAVQANYQLGVEILQCRRLVKGYSDTHSRGLSKFDKTLAAIKLVAPRDDAADWARRLREAALKDSAGKELDGVIQTIKSFA